MKLKLSPIDQLLEDYEKETLRQAFSVVGKLPMDVIKMLGQDKASMLEIIRNAIEELKSKHRRGQRQRPSPFPAEISTRCGK
jgi:hypothetical protein